MVRQRGFIALNLAAAVVLAACAPADHRSDAPAEVASIESVVKMPGASYELAHDPQRNAVWFAQITSGPSDKVWRVDVGSSATVTFPLPDVDYNGFTSHVRLGADGAVWVSLPYQVVRIEPDTGKVSSLRLAESVPDALSMATDPGAALPGTWVSDLVPDGDGALVARMNVPYLTRVDASMRAAKDIALPPEYAGAKSMLRGPDGLIYLLPAWDQEAPVVALESDKSLRVVADITPTRLIRDGARIVALGDNSLAAVITDDGVAISPVDDPRSLPWSRTNPAGTLVEYDPKRGRLIRHADGEQSVLQLDSITGVAAGAPTTVTRMEIVTDFVVADDSSVWMLRGGGSILARWAP